MRYSKKLLRDTIESLKESESKGFNVKQSKYLLTMITLYEAIKDWNLNEELVLAPCRTPLELQWVASEAAAIETELDIPPFYSYLESL